MEQQLVKDAMEKGTDAILIGELKTVEVGSVTVASGANSILPKADFLIINLADEDTVDLVDLTVSVTPACKWLLGNLSVDFVEREVAFSYNQLLITES